MEQAAGIVRIGRTSAYEQARLYIATDGADGLPAIRIGKQLRVPRAQLERWHGGPLRPPVVPMPPTPIAPARAWRAADRNGIDLSPSRPPVDVAHADVGGIEIDL